MVLRATSSIPDRNGEASSGAPAREATHIQADSSDGHRPICHRMSRCDGLPPSSPARADRGAGRRADQARRRQRPPEARASTSPRPSASSPARPPRSPRCTSSPPSCSPGGPQAFRKRLASLKGYPVVVNKWASWCAPCRTEFPIFQRQAVDAGQEGRLHRRQRGRLDRSRPPLPDAGAAALPVLPRPRRGHREDDQGARRTTRSPCSSTAAASSPTSTRAATARVRPRRRHAALPVLMASRSAGPATSEELAAALALREEVFCGEQGVHARRRPRRPRRRGAAARRGRRRRCSAPAGC